MMKKTLLCALFNLSFLFTQAQTPAFKWARQMSGSSYDSGNAIAVDASGNVYTAGYFALTADFDPGPGTATLSCNGNYDAFLSKLDASGNFVWVRHIAAGDATAYVLSVKTDVSGNIYVGGVFNGTADFDPSPGTNTVTSQGSDDMFISKLDASGNLLWSRTLGGASYDALSALCLDASGNVYATGAFSSVVDFDPGAPTYTLSAAGADIFALKLNSSGAFVWARQMVGSGTNNGSSIVENSGKLYLSGNFENTIDFDPGASTYSLTALGIYDSYILQLDASGNFGWAKQMGGAGEYTYGYALAMDGTGNVYNTGTFSGTVDLDPGPSTQNAVSAGNNDIYMSKLSNSGSFIWARPIGGTGDDFSYGIAVDGSGNSYITGSFEGNVDFDPGPGTYTIGAAGDIDLFIGKYDGTGNYVWATGYGGTFSEVYGYGICVDPAADVYATGSFNYIEDFDPSPATYTLSSVGYTDVFTLKLGQCATPAAPVIVPGPAAICAGNTASLTASATGTVSWYATATGTTAIGTGTLYTTPVLSTGTYTYYAGATTCTNSATRASVVVNVVVCPGLKTFQASEPAITVFPNPTSGRLQVQTEAYEDHTVRVYDLLGKLVMEQALTEKISTLDLEFQSAGVYFIRISKGQELLAVKRIVKE